MKHFKISFACLLTGLFFLSAKTGFSQSYIHQEIRPGSTNQEIKLLQSNLRKQGVIFKGQPRSGEKEAIFSKLLSGFVPARDR